MLNLVKTISTSVGKQGKRVVKFLRYGKSDVQTSELANNFGIDSNPIKDMVAIYGETSEKGSTVIIGYLNKNCLADPGETRIFSTDANGTLKSYSWHKADGTIEFNGNSDNLVKWKPMDSAIQQFVSKQNIENAKIATAINAIIPGLYTPAVIIINNVPSKSITLKCP